VKYFTEHKKELEKHKSANAHLNKRRNAEGKILITAWTKERNSLAEIDDETWKGGRPRVSRGGSAKYKPTLKRGKFNLLLA